MNEFKKEYNEFGAVYLAKKYGVQHSTISNFARRNGFAHTPKRAKELQRMNRKDIKL
jgi:hypothetical protein